MQTGSNVALPLAVNHPLLLKSEIWARIIRARPKIWRRSFSRRMDQESNSVERFQHKVLSPWRVFSEILFSLIFEHTMVWQSGSWRWGMNVCQTASTAATFWNASNFSFPDYSWWIFRRCCTINSLRQLNSLLVFNLKYLVYVASVAHVLLYGQSWVRVQSFLSFAVHRANPGIWPTPVTPLPYVMVLPATCVCETFCRCVLHAHSHDPSNNPNSFPTNPVHSIFFRELVPCGHCNNYPAMLRLRAVSYLFVRLSRMTGVVSLNMFSALMLLSPASTVPTVGEYVLTAI